MLGMSNKEKNLQTKVTAQIAELVTRLCNEQGLTESEYLRGLITADLDKRTFFTTKMKNGIEPEKPEIKE